jgi:hypothetical protein
MARGIPWFGNEGRSGLPVTGFEAVGGGAGGQRIEREAVLERWEGAAAAIGAVAQPARQADADLGAFEIEAVGIGQFIGSCRSDSAPARLSAILSR